MRHLLWLPLFSCLFLTQVSAATIQYTETNIAPGQFTYTYYLSGSFTQYEAIDLSFDYNTYSLLNNPQANPASNWSATAYQPTPGLINGDFVLEAMVANPSTAGPFSISFSYTGGIPGPQAFTLYQYDSNGNFQSVLGSGVTTAYTGATPEPSTLWMSAAGLLAIGVRRAMQRKKSAAA